MNKKGFTMVELLGVMALLAIVLLLVVPGLSNLASSNSNKEYETYLDMMMEYAKTIPSSKYRSDASGKYLCLDDKNLKRINDSIDCDGYVRLDSTNKPINSYLKCTKNSREVFKTDTFTLPSGC